MWDTPYFKFLLYELLKKKTNKNHDDEAFGFQLKQAQNDDAAAAAPAAALESLKKKFQLSDLHQEL